MFARIYTRFFSPLLIALVYYRGARLEVCSFESSYFNSLLPPLAEISGVRLLIYSSLL
jgi:hypothetical protein